MHTIHIQANYITTIISCVRQIQANGLKNMVSVVLQFCGMLE